MKAAARLVLILLCASFAQPARADYYSGYSWGGPRSAPIISITLDPKESLNSAFRIAARDERLEDLERFLEQGADVNSRSDEGETALMYAARNCSTEVVRALLFHGAELNAVDEQERTALIHAARDSCAPVVRILIRNRSVRVDHRDRNGKSAQDYAQENAALDVDGPALEAVQLLNLAEKRANPGKHTLKPSLASDSNQPPPQERRRIHAR